LHLRPPGSAKTLDIQYDGENKDRCTVGKLLIADVLNGNIMAGTALGPGRTSSILPLPAGPCAGAGRAGAGSARRRSGG